MAGEITTAIKTVIPFSGKDVMSFGLIFILIIFFGVLLAVGTILIYNYWKFNLRAKLFRRVGNQIVPILTDKAILERIGIGGDYWFRTKKLKKVLPRPKIQMEKNTYWFFERNDGEWINFSLKDFDEEMRNAGAFYVDEDMRLQRLGIQKNLEARFKKVSFWEKYGGMIITIIYLLVITVCLVLLFNKMEKAWGSATEMAQAVREMAEQVKNLGTRTTSGAIPVNSLFIPFLIPLWRRNIKKGNAIFNMRDGGAY